MTSASHRDLRCGERTGRIGSSGWPTSPAGWWSPGRPVAAGPGHSVVYDLVGLSAVVAILCGVRLHRPARRGIWYGLALFVAGDVLYSVYADALHVEPFPSPADALYLASYPLLAAALLIMICSRTGGRDRPGPIDALIIATGLGLLSWAFLMRPIADDPC